MKSFNQFLELEEAKLKPVVFTFGRFNPITKGHQAMIDFVVSEGKKRGGSSMIFTSQSNDPKKNPLTYNDKTKFLKKFFPKANIIKDSSVKTAFHALKYLSDKGFKDVTMVVGGDRVKDFEKSIRPYIKHEDPKKSYDFDKFEVIEGGGARVKGVSGTDMRNHVSNNDFESYKDGMPKGTSEKDAQDIFNAVRKGMGLKEYLEFGKSETTKNYKDKTPGELEEGTLKDMFKAIIGKKTMHRFNRAVNEKKYKQALQIYHQMVKNYNKNPQAQQSPGVIITNPKGLALSKAASIVGISSRELKKVLDRKTRYEAEQESQKYKEYIAEQITKANLNDVEKFADKIFAKVGIDVEFTRHFLERCNDKRNGKEITVAELTRLFKQTFKKYGKKIPKLGPDAQAVLNDIQTDINLPFVLKWDEKNGEFDLVSKTIMRKKDFKTSNQKLKV